MIKIVVPYIKLLGFTVFSKEFQSEFYFYFFQQGMTFFEIVYPVKNSIPELILYIFHWFNGTFTPETGT
jgi:hypothetical protein